MPGTPALGEPPDFAHPAHPIATPLAATCGKNAERSRQTVPAARSGEDKTQCWLATDAAASTCGYFDAAKPLRLYGSLHRLGGWLSSPVVSVLDSGAEGPRFRLQPRRCRVTVLGKLFTPIVHQAAKLVAAPLRVSGVTAGLAESNGSLQWGLWFTSPAGWLQRTGNSSGTIRSVIAYGLPLPFLHKLGAEKSGTWAYIHVRYTRANLWNRTSKLRQIFCTCYLWLWVWPSLSLATLQYAMYFRFGGWRRIFWQWTLWRRWRTSGVSQYDSQQGSMHFTAQRMLTPSTECHRKSILWIKPTKTGGNGNVPWRIEKLNSDRYTYSHSSTNAENLASRSGRF